MPFEILGEVLSDVGGGGLADIGSFLGFGTEGGIGLTDLGGGATPVDVAGIGPFAFDPTTRSIGRGAAIGYGAGSLAGGAFGSGDLAYQAFQESGGFPGMAAGTGATAGGGLWETLKGLPWAAFGTALNLGSGLLGLGAADQSRRLASRAFQAQDPFGPQRGQYQQELQGLRQDPNRITTMPGYQFGLDQGRLAIERKGAASGSGGNEAIALSQFTPQYAQQFYNDEILRLMTLSGANIGPNVGPAIAGNISANDLLSRSLNTLGRAAAAVPGIRG